MSLQRLKEWLRNLTKTPDPTENLTDEERRVYDLLLNNPDWKGNVFEVALAKVAKWHVAELNKVKNK